MKVKFKKLSKEAVAPKYARKGDAGMDLTATSKHYDNDGNVVYGTSLAFEIPEGYVGFLFPRSSNANMDLLLSNSVGVLDSGYRGEVTFKFKPSKDVSSSMTRSNKTDCKIYSSDTGIMLNLYNVGDRIGQLIIMPYPTIEFEESEELSETERGVAGYGSTGK